MLDKNGELVFSLWNPILYFLRWSLLDSIHTQGFWIRVAYQQQIDKHGIYTKTSPYHIIQTICDATATTTILRLTQRINTHAKRQAVPYRTNIFQHQYDTICAASLIQAKHLWIIRACNSFNTINNKLWLTGSCVRHDLNLSRTTKFNQFQPLVCVSRFATLLQVERFMLRNAVPCPKKSQFIHETTVCSPGLITCVRSDKH